MKINLEQPNHAGIDRILNAVACNTIRPAGTPAVIVDTGTATTVDAISPDGAFEGGSILPGFELCARALHQYTALLPFVTIDELCNESHEPLGDQHAGSPAQRSLMGANRRDSRTRAAVERTVVGPPFVLLDGRRCAARGAGDARGPLGALSLAAGSGDRRRASDESRAVSQSRTDASNRAANPGPRRIAALWTPRGRGAVATIRVRRRHPKLGDGSRLAVPAANQQPLSDQTCGRVIFGRWGDDSGEEVVLCLVDEQTMEIHCHGGEAAAARILGDCTEAGCHIVTWTEMMRATEDRLAAELAEALAQTTTLRTAGIVLEQSNGVLASRIEVDGK